MSNPACSCQALQHSFSQPLRSRWGLPAAPRPTRRPPGLAPPAPPASCRWPAEHGGGLQGMCMLCCICWAMGNRRRQNHPREQLRCSSRQSKEQAHPLQHPVSLMTMGRRRCFSSIPAASGLGVPRSSQPSVRCSHNPSFNTAPNTSTQQPALSRRRSFSAASTVCTQGSMPTRAPAGSDSASQSCSCRCHGGTRLLSKRELHSGGRVELAATPPASLAAAFWSLREHEA